MTYENIIEFSCLTEGGKLYIRQNIYSVVNITLHNFQNTFTKILWNRYNGPCFYRWNWISEVSLITLEYMILNSYCWDLNSDFLILAIG